MATARSSAPAVTAQVRATGVVRVFPRIVLRFATLVTTLVTTLLVTLLAALVAAAPVAAQGEALPPREAVVRIGSEAVRDVAPSAIAGVNLGNAMRVVGFEEAFGALNVATVRFPPGNQADEIVLGDPDLAALRQNLDLLGGPSVLMVANLFTGTPEQAAELVRLTRRHGIEVAAWEIGNEPDLYAAQRGDPAWTPRHWCDRYRTFAAAIRSVDPDARLAGPAVSGARPGGERFLRDAIGRCGDLFDLASWHVYPTDGGWDDEAALATAATVSQEIRRYRAWLSDPSVNPLGHERKIGLAVTEFGLSWRSASYRHLEDMTAALWLAETLGRLVAGGVEASHYFALQAMGGHGLIDVGGWIRPTYHVYAMLASFGGAVLPVTVDDGHDGPPLRAFAVRHAAGREVLLVNAATVPARLTLRFERGPPGPATDTYTVATLAQAASDADPAVARTALSPGEPLAVPARAVVHVRVPEPE